MRKTVFSVLIVLSMLFPSIVTSAENYQAAIEAWSRVLEKYVDEQGSIDFTSLANDTADLNKVVNYIARYSPASHSDQFPGLADKLAYHINAYNALAMHGVIEKGIPAGFNSFFKRAAFFKFRKVTIGGKQTSLYDYENKVIRPLAEARVHFALNCMVRDCPRLPKEAFLADSLEQQLQSLTREFFSKEKHIRIDHDKKTLYLSSILDFYTKDFVKSGRAKDLVSYVNQYLPQAVAEDYRVKFINYDWTINQQMKDR